MMYNRDKNKNKTNWRELMNKIDLSPIIAKIVAEHKKTGKNRRVKKVNINATKGDKNKIVTYYYTMYKNKDFDAECAFNRIQYRVDSISKNTISK